MALITAGAIEEASEEAAILIIMTLVHAEISTTVPVHFALFIYLSFQMNSEGGPSVKEAECSNLRSGPLPLDYRLSHIKIVLLRNRLVHTS